MRPTALSPRQAARAREASLRVAPSFGVVAELTRVESEVRRGLAHVRHSVQVARNAIGCGAVDVERLAEQLDRALTTIDALTGE